jgi:HPt (histidine-containing phosphotransfer) domain-containing protein
MSESMKPEIPLVDKNLVREMLYHDESYVKEFAGASIQSFSEFKKSFRQYVLAREVDSLRRAGHKIKPAALMLKLNPVIEMYEQSKIMLEENASTEDLAGLVDQMDVYCNQVLFEFKELT